MKRFVAILVTALCTAFAQVPALAVLAPDAPACPCCAKPGACGQSDCGLPPTPATVPCGLEAPASGVQAPVTRAALRTERQRSAKFYLSFVAPARSARVQPGLPGAAPPAGEPLYRVHCSLLL